MPKADGMAEVRPPFAWEAPPTGDGFSNPLSCAEVYIWGGWTELEVSGRPVPP